MEGKETSIFERLSATETAEYLTSIEGLRSANWEGLTMEGRLENLRLLESRLAEIQGRPPVPIVAEEMEDAGFFDGKALHVNIEHVKDSSMRLEVIDTVAHEGRHAYQAYAVAHPWVHENKAELMYWAANGDAYFHPKHIGEKFGPEYYLNQPKELDAWSFAAAVKEIYEEGPRARPFEQFDSMLESAYAKVETSEDHKSLLERAGDIWDRIKGYIVSKISPATQRNIFRSAVMAFAHSGHI